MTEGLLKKAKKNASEKCEKAIKYLEKELEIIETVQGDVAYKFLDQFPERVKDFILGTDRKKDHSEIYSTLPKEIKEELLIENTLYLSQVADYLKEKSTLGKYAPSAGSFWEGISETLSKLSQEIRPNI